MVAGEDCAEFEEFNRSLHDQLAPSGALEEALAERIITAFWRLRRIQRIEVEMIDAMCEDSRRAKRPDPFLQRFESLRDVLGSEPIPPEAEPVEVSLGEAVRKQLQDSDVIGKFHRYEAHIERGLFKALHELQRLQTARQGGTVPAPVAVDITAHLNQDTWRCKTAQQKMPNKATVACTLRGPKCLLKCEEAVELQFYKAIDQRERLQRMRAGDQIEHRYVC